MKFAVFVLGLLFAASAQAKTYSCDASSDDSFYKGTFTLECSQSACTADGTVTGDGIEPIVFKGCTGAIRAEKTAADKKSKNWYFDVADRGCWADYIRMNKKTFMSDKAYGSIVSTTAGDNHDWSGYEYIPFVCTPAE
jgi:hypothetical protein